MGGHFRSKSRFWCVMALSAGLLAGAQQAGANSDVDLEALVDNALSGNPPDQVELFKTLPGYQRWRDNILWPQPLPSLNASMTGSVLQEAQKEETRLTGCSLTRIVGTPTIESYAGAPAALGPVSAGIRKALYKISGEFAGDGCRNVRHSFAVFQLNDGTLGTPIAMAPGSTLAWPAVYRANSFGLGLVGVFASGQLADCKDERIRPVIVDTQLLSDTKRDMLIVGGIPYKGEWDEIWSVSICDNDAQVSISFRADERGGAYHSMKLLNAGG